MKYVIMAATAAVWICGPAAARPTQSQELSSSIASFVDAVNAGNVPQALAYFAVNASITEDLAPFRWEGPGAGSAWLEAMQKNGERMGIMDIQMKLGAPIQAIAEGDRGYEAVSGVVTLKGKRRILHESGVLTFALQRIDGHWKIVTLTWGGAAAAP